jgi:hypothetical protein
MPHLDEGRLHAWVDRDRSGITAEEIAEVERHLASCTECAALAADAELSRSAADDILERAGTLASEIPDFGSLVERTSPARVGSSRQRRLIAAAWAASIIGALGLGWISRDLLPEDQVAFRSEAADGAAEAGRGASSPPSVAPGMTPVPFSAGDVPRLPGDAPPAPHGGDVSRSAPAPTAPVAAVRARSAPAPSVPTETGDPRVVESRAAAAPSSDAAGTPAAVQPDAAPAQVAENRPATPSGDAIATLGGLHPGDPPPLDLSARSIRVEALNEQPAALRASDSAGDGSPGSSLQAGERDGHPGLREAIATAESLLGRSAPVVPGLEVRNVEAAPASRPEAVRFTQLTAEGVSFTITHHPPGSTSPFARPPGAHVTVRRGDLVFEVAGRLPEQTLRELAARIP